MMTRSSVGVLCVSIVLAGCGQKPAPENAAGKAAENQVPSLTFPLQKTTARLQRGQYLTTVAACFDCHSERLWKEPDAPPKPGMLAAGQVYPLEGLPGRLVAPNLTPDKETGIGNASDEDIYKAITQGIGKDGRTLFPLMPYGHYRELSDEDLASIIVYIRTLPPVRHELPKTQLAPPVMASLKPLPPRAGNAPAPDLSDPVKRGAYMGNLGSCFDCHTPVDAKGAPLPGMDYGGGMVLKGPWGEVASANITPDPSGVPYYDEASFVETMRTGKVKGSRKLNVLMPVPYYRNMTDEDLKALYAWVKTLKPVKHRVDNADKPTLCKICGQRHGLGALN
ncbi:MAG TPA: c-type cytochrome [Verrucomicrobiae bacterium]|nr:c-type cytochrome [Verrucomicrobiae bacterium]